jgi:hypothetical protein
MSTLARWLVAVGFATAAVAGVAAEPAYAQMRNPCQDLANQARTHAALAQSYNTWSLFYAASGDVDSARQAQVWSDSYRQLAQEDLAQASALGC